MIISNENGITLGELKDFVNKRIDEVGPDGEVWIGNGNNLSNVCVELVDLGRDDILLEVRDD